VSHIRLHPVTPSPSSAVGTATPEEGGQDDSHEEGEGEVVRGRAREAPQPWQTGSMYLPHNKIPSDLHAHTSLMEVTIHLSYTVNWIIFKR
jgi:hypothetical protein